MTCTRQTLITRRGASCRVNRFWICSIRGDYGVRVGCGEIEEWVKGLGGHAWGPCVWWVSFREMYKVGVRWVYIFEY